MRIVWRDKSGRTVQKVEPCSLFSPTGGKGGEEIQKVELYRTSSVLATSVAAVAAAAAAAKAPVQAMGRQPAAEAVAKQTVVLAVVLIASRATVLSVQAAILNMQASTAVATVSTASRRQRCGVRCRGRKAEGVPDLENSKEARVSAKNTQHVMHGKMRKIAKINFEFPTKKSRIFSTRRTRHSVLQLLESEDS